jgi:hypothetical protein
VVERGHGDYNFLYGKGSEYRQLGTGFLYTTEYCQQLREWILLVTGCQIHIAMRGRWCNIIVLNVPAPSDVKSDDSKDSFMRIF